MSLAGRLAAASALVVGAGGLGSPAALALAASGVGRIGLVDNDVVDLTNLARQILHATPDVGRPKADSGAERLRRLAPACAVEAHRERLGGGNAAALIGGYDVVLDGSDNLATRMRVNEVCVRLGKPLVTGAVSRFFGQLLTVLPGEGPCYRCLTGPEAEAAPAAPCAQTGVFGAVAGVVGMAQAAEAVRILAGRRPLWLGRLMTADLWEGRLGAVAVAADPDCPACGRGAEAAGGGGGRLSEGVSPAAAV